MFIDFSNKSTGFLVTKKKHTQKKKIFNWGYYMVHCGLECTQRRQRKHVSSPHNGQTLQRETGCEKVVTIMRVVHPLHLQMASPDENKVYTGVAA